MLEIMKFEGHSSLEGCSDVLKDKRHLSVCECTPRKNKCCLMLVLGLNLNSVNSGRQFGYEENISMARGKPQPMEMTA
jgi:hypothetical protein